MRPQQTHSTATIPPRKTEMRPTSDWPWIDPQIPHCSPSQCSLLAHSVLSAHCSVLTAQCSLLSAVQNFRRALHTKLSFKLMICHFNYAKDKGFMLSFCIHTYTTLFTLPPISSSQWLRCLLGLVVCVLRGWRHRGAIGAARGAMVSTAAERVRMRATASYYISFLGLGMISRCEHAKKETTCVHSSRPS